MTHHLLEAYKVDIDGRMNGLEPSNPQGIKMEVEEIEEGLVYQDDLVKVEAFLVKHPPFKAYGYKFTTPDKVIVVSGDTIPTENLIKHAKDCDILIHEVYSSQGVKMRSPLWKKYHTSVHTSSLELGEIARKVNAKKLVLYHQLFFRVPDEDGNRISEVDREIEMINEIKQNYSGEVISAKDLDIII